MSTRLLRTLTDENQDLQKQIGCMNGIFQLFDRHNFLGGRRINNRSHKRLLPGQNGNQGTEPDTALQKNTGRNPKLVKENKQISTESSKTSLSSSTSSSFSSLDYKTAQFEPPSSNQLIFSKTLTRPMNKQNASLLSSPRSLDLREVVKGSINREVRALSIKTAGKEDAAGSTLTYIDSPRPLQPTKSVSRASGLNNSARNPAKPWGAPRNHKEEKDGLMLSSLKDAPRLSYDGRVSQEVSKSTIRIKELPRLSLDSREGSLRGTASETTKNFLLKDLHGRNGNSSTVLNQQQEPESSKPPSSIIAKLMGLEAFPESTATTANPLGIISSCRTTKSPSSESSRTTDGNKQNRICGSPRNLQKDPIVVRLKNDDSVLSPTSKSKLRTEPTPWRQPYGCQSSQQTAFKYGEATSRASNSSPSVYGEIEKRLAELEFKKSGKDLRALKQILEAMQKTKGALDTKSEQASNFDSQTSTYRVSHQSSTLASPRKLKNKDPNSAIVEGSHSPKSYKSPVVVMKPVNLSRRTSDRASSTIPTGSMSGLCKHGHTETGRNIDMQTSTDLTPRSNHLKDNFSRLSCSTDKDINVKTSKSTPALKVSRSIIRENTKSSETVSPRPQQRKLRLQKQSPPTIPSSDSSKTMRQHSRQPMGSDSRDRQLGPKSPSLLQGNDQSSESSSDWRDPSHQGDTVSLQSESNISSYSHINREITSSNQSDKTTSSFQQDGLKEKNPARFSGDRVMVEPAIATLEQPSPVSVLDATFYRDESPSPVKKISNAFKDYEAQDDDEEEWVPVDHAQPKYTIPSFSADSVNQKSKSTHHLLQNLPQIDCTGEEPITNYITALNEDTNSDHRYVSEILLASGLLRVLDFGSMTTHLQTSGHPLSSNLFLALERKNTSAGLLNDKQSNKTILKSEPSEKIQRILIFDIVNEILVRKLLLEGPPQQWFSPNMLAGRKPRGQQLLEELCSELDQLQNNNLKRSLHEEDDSLESIIWENLMHHSMDWNCNHEIPNLVLDLERLIFKDLITEVVNSEGAGLQGQPGGRCRKLFSM